MSKSLVDELGHEIVTSVNCTSSVWLPDPCDLYQLLNKRRTFLRALIHENVPFALGCRQIIRISSRSTVFDSPRHALSKGFLQPTRRSSVIGTSAAAESLYGTPRRAWARSVGVGHKTINYSLSLNKNKIKVPRTCNVASASDTEATELKEYKVR
jgi:hypothetical protein